MIVWEALRRWIFPHFILIFIYKGIYFVCFWTFDIFILFPSVFPCLPTLKFSPICLASIGTSQGLKMFSQHSSVPLNRPLPSSGISRDGYLAPTQLLFREATPPLNSNRNKLKARGKDKNFLAFFLAQDRIFWEPRGRSEKKRVVGRNRKKNKLSSG